MTKVSERNVLSHRRKQVAGLIREYLDAEHITYYGLVSKTSLVNHASTTTLQNESFGVVMWISENLTKLVAEYRAAPDGNNRLPEHPAYLKFKHALLENWIESLGQYESAKHYAVRNGLSPISLSRVKNGRAMPSTAWFMNISDYQTPVLLELDGQLININSPEGYKIAHDLASTDFIKTVNRCKLTRCGQRAVVIDEHVWMAPLSMRLVNGTLLPGSLDVLLNLLANVKGKLKYSFGVPPQEDIAGPAVMLRLTDALLSGNITDAIDILRPIAKRHTFSKVAKETGMSVSSVYKFFGGDVEPTYRTFMRILKVLGLKMTITA